jgi:hypothetical protein
VNANDRDPAGCRAPALASSARTVGHGAELARSTVCALLLGALKLRYAGRPEASNVDGVIGHAIVDQPISSVKPTVPAKAAPFCSYRIHMRKKGKRWQFLKYCLPVAVRKFFKQFPRSAGPDDPVLHLFLLFALLARDILTTLLCGMTRPVLMSASDFAIIF